MALTETRPSIAFCAAWYASMPPLTLNRRCRRRRFSACPRPCPCFCRRHRPRFPNSAFSDSPRRAKSPPAHIPSPSSSSSVAVLSNLTTRIVAARRRPKPKSDRSTPSADVNRRRIPCSDDPSVKYTSPECLRFGSGDGDGGGGGGGGGEENGGRGCGGEEEDDDDERALGCAIARRLSSTCPRAPIPPAEGDHATVVGGGDSARVVPVGGGASRIAATSVSGCRW